MKRGRAIALIYVVIFAVTLGVYSTVTAYGGKNLYNFATSNKTISVYIGAFKTSENAKDIDARKLAENLKLRLRDRKTINFSIVDNIKDADLAISGNLIEFIYWKNDPIDIFIPLGLVIDLVTNKNYARLEYNISVLDTKKNKVVWEKHLKATLTEFDMPKEKSIPLVTERAAYVFVKECFGRPKAKDKI